MINQNIYEVSREEYKGFVNEIKPQYRDVRVEQLNDLHTATKIFSINTGKCLCSRVYYSAKEGEPDPERYFIFEMPEPYERLPAKPVQKIVLTTKEQVQNFFDFIAKQNQREK